MTRADTLYQFRVQAGWGTATETPITGDASARRYTRLTQEDGQTAVLMDAPPDTGEQTEPFVRIARHLTDIGFTAPQILAWDEPAGLILLEDLGDDLITRVCEADPAREPQIYADIARLLVALQSAPVPGWAQPYGPTEMAAKVDLFFDHYAPMPPQAARDLTAALQDTLTQHAPEHSALILRDFHAENLLDLPNRPGHQRFGLLDFQDALAGHPTYDLASLIQDARRDVSSAATQAAVTAFCDASGRDMDHTQAAIAVQGAQRNLRILGIFARLTRMGKPKYDALQPRVRAHLATCLQHPALRDVARLLNASAPDHGPWT